MEHSPHPLLSENSAEKALYRVCTDFTLSLESVKRQGRQQPPDLLFTGMIDRSTYYSAILSTFSTNCPLLRLEHQHIFQDQALPVRTRLWDHAQRAQWRGLSLSPEGHGMSPPSLCWARTNSPVNIRDFNHKLRH